METDGGLLMAYAHKNFKFWTWPPDEYHEVTFLGFDLGTFRFESGKDVPTVRYYFRFSDGVQKPRDVRSGTFAAKMAIYQAGDRLRFRRSTLPEGKYSYEVSKIE